MSQPLDPGEVAAYDQTIAALHDRVSELADALHDGAAASGMMQASADMTAYLMSLLAELNGQGGEYVPTVGEASLMGILIAALQRLAGQPPSV